MDTSKRFYFVANVTGAAVALAAALVNVFVGPSNADLWLVPIFILAYAAITHVLVVSALAATEQPTPGNWMVRRLLGRRIVRLLRKWSRWNMRVVSPVFLYFVPFVFLIAAVLLLVLALRGQITPGG